MRKPCVPSLSPFPFVLSRCRSGEGQNKPEAAEKGKNHEIGRNKEEITGEKRDEKSQRARLSGFRAVYVFDGSSRDLRPSPFVLDVIRERPFGESPR
jgi:hypothetical protein